MRNKVTRTFKTKVVLVKAFNKAEGTVEEFHKYIDARTKDSKIEQTLNEMLGSNYKVVDAVVVATNEQLYAMDETYFMEHAEMVTPKETVVAD